MDLVDRLKMHSFEDVGRSFSGFYARVTEMAVRNRSMDFTKSLDAPDATAKMPIVFCITVHKMLLGWVQLYAEKLKGNQNV